MESHLGPMFNRPPASPVCRLFLIRHGSTAANESRPFVLQGSEIDGPLTDRGKTQAATLTRFLSNAHFDAVYCSPMVRARQTVEAIAASRSLPIHTIDELKECRVGHWAGLSWVQIRERDPDLCEQFLSDPASVKHPGGESYEQLQQRVVPSLEAIFKKHPGQNVLVLAHNMVNRAAIAHFLGLDLRYARKIRQSNCAINILQHHEGTTDVVTINSIWHLEEE